MSARRRPGARPRYGRMAAATTSLVVTSTAVLGGLGMFQATAKVPTPGGGIAPVAAPVLQRDTGGATEPMTAPVAAHAATTPGERRRTTAADLLPADSGEGRRVVFSEGAQRVWLVARDGEVRRTYLVSGSLHNNLEPGSYDVYSRSLNAIGIDDSGTMKYFVRFTQGDSGAAIGFHDIPVDDGSRVQGFDELGTPTSHGCIRQRRADARAMWGFAQLGTTVVVTP